MKKESDTSEVSGNFVMNNENLQWVSVLVHQNDPDQRKANKIPVEAKDRTNQGDILKMGDNENTMSNDNVSAKATRKESRGLFANLEHDVRKRGRK